MDGCAETNANHVNQALTLLCGVYCNVPFCPCTRTCVCSSINNNISQNALEQLYF